MAEMTSAERVRRVLQRQEPDRVPHFEWLIARNVREALCPGCKSHNEFALRMGHDALLVSPDFGNEQVGPTSYRSEWGYVKDYGTEEHGVETVCPIQSMADFEEYTPPDPYQPGRYATIEKTVAEWKDKMAIGVHLNDVFSIPRSLMGMGSLLTAIALEPELIRALVDMSVEVNLAMAAEVAKRVSGPATITPIIPARLCRRTVSGNCSTPGCAESPRGWRSTDCPSSSTVTAISGRLSI
jgi:hypothetical protein